jgi:hypothetical protein
MYSPLLDASERRETTLHDSVERDGLENEYVYKSSVFIRKKRLLAVERVLHLSGKFKPLLGL